MPETPQPLPRNPERFAKLSADTEPVLPAGLCGYLAFNPAFGTKSRYHQPMFIFSTNPADAIGKN